MLDDANCFAVLDTNVRSATIDTIGTIDTSGTMAGAMSAGRLSELRQDLYSMPGTEDFGQRVGETPSTAADEEITPGARVGVPAKDGRGLGRARGQAGAQPATSAAASGGGTTSRGGRSGGRGQSGGSGGRARVGQASSRSAAGGAGDPVASGAASAEGGSHQSVGVKDKSSAKGKAKVGEFRVPAAHPPSLAIVPAVPRTLAVVGRRRKDEEDSAQEKDDDTGGGKKKKGGGNTEEAQKAAEAAQYFSDEYYQRHVDNGYVFGKDARFKVSLASLEVSPCYMPMHRC